MAGAARKTCAGPEVDPGAGREIHAAFGCARPQHGRDQQVAPGANGAAALYEDDGETRAYARGTSVTREFRHQTEGDTLTISIGAPAGPYRPASRDVWLLARRAAPARVTAGGAPIPRVTFAELATHAGAAWSVDESGVVTVRMHDDFVATTVSLEGVEAPR